MAKRKTSPKKTSTGRRRPTKRRRSSFGAGAKVYLLGGAVGALILAILLSLAGWIGYEAGKEKALQNCERRVADYRKDLRRLREKLRDTTQKEAPVPRQKPTDRSRKTPPPAPKKGEPSEVRDYESAGGEAEEVSRRKAKEESAAPKRPRLVIIIDDVAYASQLEAIQKLPWRITPSIFPPTPGHPETPRIAADLEHYMIHLPMEALRYNNPEDDTLTTSSGSSEIDLRLRKLRRWFPRARFVNNHTGSRFTADRASMERFFPIAGRYGFVFVDSRTTPRTVVPDLCRRYGLPYLARDIFLDNEENLSYIRGQLKKAVRLARSHGYAIAIGHPHKTTLRALAGAGDILKGVQVVYIDELYETLR